MYKYIIDSKFENSKVLDIGCGTGTLANFLPKSVNYLGYDFNENYIFEAKKHFAENGNIEFLLLNAYEKVELNQTFDFKLISGLLHQLDDSGVENVFNVQVLTISSFYRVYTITLLKKVKQQYDVLISENGFICMLEILLKSISCNAKIIEVPMTLNSNKRIGKSKMKIFKTIFEYLIFVISFKKK